MELAQQDARAFGALYRRHHPTIARYVHRRIADPEAARDVVSETFLLALKKLDAYRHRGLPFRSWLYRLATTSIHRHLRRARTFEPLDEPAERAGPRHANERREVIQTALARLAPRYQSALSLHYLEGLSVEEVSRVLGCRPGTIKARLSRGREKLRPLLEPLAQEYGT